MMWLITNFGLKTIEELDNARAVRMPYNGKALDMIVILPNKTKGLYAMEKKMKTVDMTQAMSGFWCEAYISWNLP